jgi:hypothetical protein
MFLYTILTQECFVNIDNLSLIELLGITWQSVFMDYPAPSSDQRISPLKILALLNANMDRQISLQ